MVVVERYALNFWRNGHEERVQCEKAHYCDAKTTSCLPKIFFETVLSGPLEIFTNSNGEIFTITDLTTRGEEQVTAKPVFESRLVVAVVLHSFLSRAQNEKFSRRVVSLWTRNHADNHIFSRSADRKLSIQVFILLLNSR